MSGASLSLCHSCSHPRHPEYSAIISEGVMAVEIDEDDQVLDKWSQWPANDE